MSDRPEGTTPDSQGGSTSADGGAPARRRPGGPRRRRYGLGRWIALGVGPVIGVLPLLIPGPAGLTVEAWRLCGVAGWMVVWWLSEAIPIPATALLPIPIIPLFGIAPEQLVTARYAHPLIFLFMGGFFIAGAMQRWGLHRRVALAILSAVGVRADRVVLGFMLACALLSMWMSNTATAVMMMPVGLSVLEEARQSTKDETIIPRFGVALMLGIAYGCSIGGVGTLIGTPPNGLLASFLSDGYGYRMTFSKWLGIGMPFVVIFLPVTWLYLTRVAQPVRSIALSGVAEHLEEERAALGPMSRGEKIVACAFLTAAFLWIVGPFIAEATDVPLTDTTVAMGVGLALFVVPTSVERGRFALDWKTARNIPWGVLLLFGGGLALAAVFQETKLAEAVGEAFRSVEVTTWLAVALIAGVILMLTELTSNTATTATFLPIVMAIALSWGENPLLFLVPIAIAASGAFMLPVATPPNAIVFGYEKLRIADMARTGLALNVLCIVVVVLLDWFVWRPLLGIEIGVVPDWVP